MKKTQRTAHSIDSTPKKPQLVPSRALSQAQGGALDAGALDDLVGKDSDQHNETLVEDR